MRNEIIHHIAAGFATPFPGRTDVRWETSSCEVWNPREGAAEPHELIYEVSWVEELGTWRRFLTSQRKVN